MALKISSAGKPITFWQKVTIKRPNDRDSFDTETCRGHFKMLDVDEVNKAAADENAMRNILREALFGWSEVTDEDTGAVIDFTEELRDYMLRQPIYITGFWEAYIKGVNGGAKAKN